jgi:hypothetical protein
LPAANAVAFLEKCLQRFDQADIQGYRLLMLKQERVAGKLHPPEEIEVCFRAQPYSVFMRWRKGARKITTALYVQGENDDKMLVHPTGLAGRLINVVAVDPNGPQARESGNYSITEFGLRPMLARTLKSWKAAQEKGTLHVDYLGVRKIPAIGDRLCYTFRRTQQPDATGITEVLVSIDKETWFPVSTVERGDGELYGYYKYRDIELNPTFKESQYTRAALTQ